MIIKALDYWKRIEENNYKSNQIQKWDSFIENWIYDENEIITSLTKNIGAAMKSFSADTFYIKENNSKLDDIDFLNLFSWYEKYKIISSYPSSRNKKFLDQDTDFISSIKSKKWKCDLMNLVEISVSSLLEKSLFDLKYEVRVRKTSDFDDFRSGIDYIVEYFDKDKKLTKVVWIDLSISNNSADIETKKLQKRSKPIDYIKYARKKHNLNLESVPRLVLHIDRDYAFSLTNNYFVSVLEKWNLLDSDEINDILLYSTQDLENKLNKRTNKLASAYKDIWELVELTKTVTSKIINKPKKYDTKCKIHNKNWSTKWNWKKVS